MTPEEKKAKYKQWYENCKKEGRCVSCGKYDIEPGYIKCDDCRKKEHQQRQKRKEQRKAANLCMKCGKNPPIQGQTCCRECQDKTNERNLELYYWRKENNICSKCGREEAAKGKTLCLTCLSDKTLYNITHKKRRSRKSKALSVIRKGGKNALHAGNVQCAVIRSCQAIHIIFATFAENSKIEETGSAALHAA